jgi:putative nucleotidyltransferase with HDIG domain
LFTVFLSFYLIGYPGIENGDKSDYNMNTEEQVMSVTPDNIEDQNKPQENMGTTIGPEEYRARLELLYDVAQKASSVAEVTDLLTEITRVIQQILKASASSLFMIDEEKREFCLRASAGEKSDLLQQIRLDLDSGIVGWVARYGVPVVVNDVSQDERFNRAVDEATGFVARSIIAAPLMRGQRVIGVLEMINRVGSSPFNEKDLGLITEFATTEALILLVSMVATLINNLKMCQEIRDDYKSTVETLVTAADAKDPYACGHSRRVREYTLLAANSLGFPPEELRFIEFGALLHDIGKIGVDERILSKSEPLTSEEWYIIRKHALKGADIVREIPNLEKAAAIVLYHHERYDGTGYPEGLKGEHIPIGARLVAVADAFDTMTTEHSYRAALSIDEAINELIKGTGTQFCPVAVKTFLSGFRKQKDMLAGKETELAVKDEVGEEAEKLVRKQAEQAARERARSEAEAARKAREAGKLVRKQAEQAARERARSEAEAARKAMEAEKLARKQAEQAARERAKSEAEAAREAMEAEKLARKQAEQAIRERARSEAEAVREAMEAEKLARKQAERAVRERARSEAEAAGKAMEAVKLEKKETEHVAGEGAGIAIEMVEKAEGSGDAATWMERGIALSRLGRNEEALAAFVKVIELDPENAVAWRKKGTSLGRLGRDEEALAASVRALELDPTDVAAWSNKAFALSQLGRSKEAREAKEAEKLARKQAERTAKKKARGEVEAAKKAKEAEKLARKQAEPATKKKAKRGSEADEDTVKAVRDISSELYEGDVRLVIEPLISYEEKNQFRESLRTAGNLRIVSDSWSEEDGNVIIVSVQEPMALGRILSEMPAVAGLYEKRENIVVVLKTPRES